MRTSFASLDTRCIRHTHYQLPYGTRYVYCTLVVYLRVYRTWYGTLHTLVGVFSTQPTTCDFYTSGFLSVGSFDVEKYTYVYWMAGETITTDYGGSQERSPCSRCNRQNDKRYAPLLLFLSVTVDTNKKKKEKKKKENGGRKGIHNGSSGNS
jgi:hypothetical protein